MFAISKMELVSLTCCSSISSRCTQKSMRMDRWENLNMYAYRKQRVLIEEQQVNDTNSIFEIANIQPQHDTAQ